MKFYHCYRTYKNGTRETEVDRQNVIAKSGPKAMETAFPHAGFCEAKKQAGRTVWTAPALAPGHVYVVFRN